MDNIFLEILFFSGLTLSFLMIVEAPEWERPGDGCSNKSSAPTTRFFDVTAPPGKPVRGGGEGQKV